MTNPLTSGALATWRITRGLSQAALADFLGVERNTVSRWELGERQIPHLAAIALDHYDCTAAENELREAERAAEAAAARVATLQARSSASKRL